MTPYWDRYIQSATLKLYEFWSWSCIARQWESWKVPYVSSTLRWSNQPAAASPNYLQGTTTTTTGYNSSCVDAWVSIDMTETVQDSVTGHATTATTMFKATSETDSLGWKKFRSLEATSGDPYVVVNYTSYPTVGTRSTTPGTICATGSSRPYINTATPTLKAQISDPEGASVKAEFEW